MNKINTEHRALSLFIADPQKYAASEKRALKTFMG